MPDQVHGRAAVLAVRLLYQFLRPVEEVGRLDDQRIALPMTDGIAEPLLDVAVWAAVDGNNSSIAVFLVQDRHEAGTLHDAVMSAIRSLPHERRHAIGQATLTRVGVEIRLVRADAVARAGPRLRLARIVGVRQPAVARIDDERSLRIDLPGAPVKLPGRVVLVTANRRVLDRRPPDGFAVEPGELLGREVLLDPRDLGHFLWRQKRPAFVAGRALERNRGLVAPDAL